MAKGLSKGHDKPSGLSYIVGDLTELRVGSIFMGEEQFEWDGAKAQNNLAKHGVSFEAAAGVFFDVFAFDQVDLESEPGEVRYIITGMVNGVPLTVVYTERGDQIRIISARKATKHEQKEYYRSQTAE